ncbi:hypothetical protein I8J38_16990, partial [Bacillus sp. OA1]|nr:hypothetical protein [Bacillus sp. OA1]
GVEVPGDFSSAAFFLVAATVVPGSDLLLTGVGHSNSFLICIMCQTNP